MGVAGGGYALVLAVSVIGGNSDAPWVLIPGASDEKSDSVRVVPQRGDDVDEAAPAANAEAGFEGGRPEASESAAAEAVGNKRAERAGSAGSTPAGKSAGVQSKAKLVGDTKSGGGTVTGGGGTTGEPAGGPPAGGNPPAASADGGASGPTDAPAEPTPTTTPEPEDEGLLGGLLGGLIGESAADGT